MKSQARNADAGWIPLAAGLSAMILFWDLLGLTEILKFDPFAFGDPGSNLTISYLVSRGYRPVFDFGYAYGLLGILTDMIWFRAVPLSPAGYLAASVLCQIGLACGIARTARLLALKPIQLVFLFVAIGRAVMPTYWNFAHGLEAVLISFALAEHARGARANALGLTTAAVFAKPSMGFVYSALLIALMAASLYRRGSITLSAWFNQLKIAAAVGISLGAVLAVVFGADLVWRTVLPISGAANYRTMKMGFFGTDGSTFWHPPHATWHYYPGTMIGLWAVATGYLIWGAIPAAVRLWRNLAANPGSAEARRDEIIFSCALLHLAFVFFFYGLSGSWVYYSYLLIAGAAAVPVDAPFRRAALSALIVVAAISYYGEIKGSIFGWRAMSRSPVTANLWSQPAVRDDWTRVLTLSKGRRVVALHYAGAVELMFPEFEPPSGTYFTPALESAPEIEHEVARIDSADMIVVPTLPGWGGPAPTPETDRALARFKLTERMTNFSVYEPR